MTTIRFLVFSLFWVSHSFAQQLMIAQPQSVLYEMVIASDKSAAQTAQDFYKWYTTKGYELEWKQVLKRPEFTPALRKRLTAFYQKMEKEGGGYDPIVQAQDFDDKFILKPKTNTPTKATFELWLFEQKVATVTLINLNNQWSIDAIEGVL